MHLHKSTVFLKSNSFAPFSASPGTKTTIDFICYPFFLIQKRMFQWNYSRWYVICKLIINTMIQKGRIYVAVIRNVMQINLIVSHGRMLLNFLEATFFSFFRVSLCSDWIWDYKRVGVATLLHFSFNLAFACRLWFKFPQ